MVDLTTEMGQLLGTLSAALGPGADARGRVVQFVASRTGEGASTIAREFARVAAAAARRPVWLVDADLERQTQMRTIHAEPDRFGRLSKAARASPDGSAFFALHPPMLDHAGAAVAPARLLSARAALDGRLWVTQVRHDPMDWSHAPRIARSPAYWEALRRHASWICVDSPAGERAHTALELAPFMDATVMVVAADAAEAGDVQILREAIAGAGGRIAGVVLNKTAGSVVAPAQRRRAG